MAKFTAYAVTVLPSTGIDVSGIYFVKASGDTHFTAFIRKNDNSDWVPLGLVGQVNTVNGLNGDVQLDLSFSGGVLTLTGSSGSINLDTRYTKNSDNIDWSRIINEPDFALDSDVVHASEKGAPNGVATLDGSGLIPTNQLPSYVDDVLEYATLSAFPATGETGKIYVALDTNKTYRWSGSTYVEISPSAVNSVFGRTGAVTAQGGDYAAFYPRFDAAQTLNSSQKTQVLSNIGAADDTAVVHKTGAETVAGVKTFSASPVVPNATNNNQAAAYGQISTVGDGKYVRYDTAAQGLTTAQKNNARTNIDAAATADLNWGQKDW